MGHQYTGTRVEGSGKAHFGDAYYLGGGCTKQDNPLKELSCAEDAPFNAYSRQRKRTCLDGTRTDVLAKIYKWAGGHDERRLFWLNGMAGTGKSTIARTVADQFDAEERLGASFFFSRDGTDDVRNARMFVMTMAKQLASYSPALRKYICESVQQKRQIATTSLKYQWDHLVLRPLSKIDNQSCPSPCIMVIDALDECDNEDDIETILRLLARPQSAESVQLRVFMTGRPDTPVRHVFRSISRDKREDFVLHRISPAVLDQDIRLLLEDELRDIAERCGLDTDWPGEETIRRLVENASGLIIWADTACRFIRDDTIDAEERLATVLQTDRSDSSAPERKLDEIYITVLEQSILPCSTDGAREKRYRTLRCILGSIAALLSPLSSDSLSSLLGVAPNDVNPMLQRLRAILDIPTDRGDPLKLHHPSFRDFFFHERRSGKSRFWVDEKRMHDALAMRCIDILSKSLEQDICGVNSPGAFVTDIEASLVEQKLPPAVEYACLYWVQHLHRSRTQVYDEGEVHRFLQKHLLHWIEALSWLEIINEGIRAIFDLESISLFGPCPRLHSLIRDIKLLMLENRLGIEAAPLQVYCSLLLFAPTGSQVAEQFKEQRFSNAQILPHTQNNRGALLQKIESQSEIRVSIAFSPDGRQLVWGSDETVKLWEPATGALLHTLECDRDMLEDSVVDEVTFLSDGKMIAATMEGRFHTGSSVHVWDAETGALQILHDNAEAGSRMVFSPDGETVVAVSKDGEIHVCDVSRGASLRIFVPQLRDPAAEGYVGLLGYIAMSPDGKKIAISHFGYTVELLDAATGTVLHTFKGHRGTVRYIVFSPQSSVIASASFDRTVRLWDVETGNTLTLEGHSRQVNAIAFSPDGTMLASASDDETICLWNSMTGVALKTLVGHTNAVVALTFSPDGEVLVSASRDRTMRLWDAVTCGASQSTEGRRASVTRSAISPDGNTVAAALDDNTVQLWDTDTGVVRSMLISHTESHTYLAISPDSRTLASASADYTLRLWDAATGELQWTLFEAHSPYAAVVFSPDSKIVTSPSYGTLRLWNVATGTVSRTLTHSGLAYSVAFSPDGSIVALGGVGVIWLWMTATGAEILRLTRHEAYAAFGTMAFMPDGMIMASASSNDTITIWNLATGVALQTLRFDYDDTNISKIFASNEGLYIRSLRADELYYIRPDSAGIFAEAPPPLHTPFRRGDWIVCRGEYILWLPPDYRSLQAFQGNVFVFKDASAQLIFLTFGSGSS